MMFTEGKKVKRIEGVPTPVALRVHDAEAAVFNEEEGQEKKPAKVVNRDIVTKVKPAGVE
jgi:hypothetical protein